MRIVQARSSRGIWKENRNFQYVKAVFPVCHFIKVVDCSFFQKSRQLPPLDPERLPLLKEFNPSFNRHPLVERRFPQLDTSQKLNPRKGGGRGESRVAGKGSNFSSDYPKEGIRGIARPAARLRVTLSLDSPSG